MEERREDGVIWSGGLLSLINRITDSYGASLPLVILPGEEL